jgi:hypothetical protein
MLVQFNACVVVAVVIPQPPYYDAWEGKEWLKHKVESGDTCAGKNKGNDELKQN